MKGLSVSKEEMHSETDFQCTYCESSQNIISCRVNDSLELACTTCGRHGEAVHSNGEITTGPFFNHLN